MAPNPSVRDVLAAAVHNLGGTERLGQVRMAEAVAAAMSTGEHLLVQAGTGTGKTLAYLVPALLNRRPVVVATATLGLQAQLIQHDLPRVVTAAEPLLGRRPTFAILKGRNNYVCRHRVGGGGEPVDEGPALFDPGQIPGPSSPLGREVHRAREWAESTESGDRDDLLPGVSDRAWTQVSVGSRECLGATRCPQGADCFAELARARAGEADLVVTNHALLAIDALENIPLLPDHGVVVVDEAHELADRFSAVATAELTAAGIERAVRAATRVAGERAVEILAGVGEGLAATLATVAAGTLNPMPVLLGAELAAVRDAARAVLTSISTSKEDAPEELLAKRIARAAVEEIVETAGRLAVPNSHDVAWLRVDERRGRVLRVAPLSVAGLLRESLFGSRTVVLTSATLAVGGGFEITAGGFGLGPEAGDAPAPATPAERDARAPGSSGPGATTPAPPGAGDDAHADDEGAAISAPPTLKWRGLDVGSPFDYRRQGILYVARALAPPGRDGLSAETLDELAGLITAAGGATLGLFSSRRAAEQAVEELRPRLPFPLLCQGEGTLGELVSRFAAEEETCLFGTLSLWQGIDVPGRSCRLVAIDRIPFPRPDDPLATARARAADQAGGNGFMSVFAAHAAVRLAQGVGRLIRMSEDRGVVALLDPRMATARYGSFLRSTLPPFWYTSDGAVARAALHRLAAVPGADPRRSATPLALADVTSDPS